MSFDPWVKACVDLAIASVRDTLVQSTGYSDFEAFDTYATENRAELYANPKLVRAADSMRRYFGQEARSAVLVNLRLAEVLLPTVAYWPYASDKLRSFGKDPWEDQPRAVREVIVAGYLKVLTDTPLESAADIPDYVRMAFSVRDAVEEVARVAGRRFRKPSVVRAETEAAKPKKAPVVRKKAPAQIVKDFTALDEALVVGDLVRSYAYEATQAEAKNIERARYFWTELVYGLQGWKSAHGNPHKHAGLKAATASDDLLAFLGAYGSDGTVAHDYIERPDFLTEYPGPWDATPEAARACAAWTHRAEGCLLLRPFVGLWREKAGMDVVPLLEALCNYNSGDLVTSWRLEIDAGKALDLDESPLSAVRMLVPTPHYFTGHIGPRFAALDGLLAAVEATEFVPDSDVAEFLLAGLKEQHTEKAAYTTTALWSDVGASLDPRDTYIPLYVLSAWINATLQVALPAKAGEASINAKIYPAPVSSVELETGNETVSLAGVNEDVKSASYWNPEAFAPVENHPGNYSVTRIKDFREIMSTGELTPGYAPQRVKLVRTPASLTVALRSVHTVLSGQTKAEVADLYLMDEDELTELNPHIMWGSGINVAVYAPIPLLAIKDTAKWKLTYRVRLSDRVRLLLGWLNSNYSMFSPDPLMSATVLNRMWKGAWAKQPWPEGYPIMAGALGADNVVTGHTWTLGNLVDISGGSYSGNVPPLLPGLAATGRPDGAMKIVAKKLKDIRKDERRTAYSEAFRASFRCWINLKENKKYQDAVLKAYTDIWLSYRTPEYSGDPITNELVRAVVTKFVPDAYQSEGARRLVAEGGGMLAYDVGVGKTLTALLALAQAKQEGKAKRAVISVPNSITAKWEQDVRDTLPGYRIVIVGQKRVRPTSLGTKRLYREAVRLGTRLFAQHYEEADRIARAGKKRVSSAWAHKGDKQLKHKIPGVDGARFSAMLDSDDPSSVESLQRVANEIASYEAEVISLRGSAFWTSAGFSPQVYDEDTQALVPLYLPIPDLVVKSETPEEIVAKWNDVKNGRYDVAICSHGVLGSHTALRQDRVYQHIATSQPILRVLDKGLFGETSQGDGVKVANSHGGELLDELVKVIGVSGKQLLLEVLGQVGPGGGYVDVSPPESIWGKESSWSIELLEAKDSRRFGQLALYADSAATRDWAPTTGQSGAGLYVLGKSHGGFDAFLEVDRGLVGHGDEVRVNRGKGDKWAGKWGSGGAQDPGPVTWADTQWRPSPFSVFTYQELSPLWLASRGGFAPLNDLVRAHFTNLPAQDATELIEGGAVYVNKAVETDPLMTIRSYEVVEVTIDGVTYTLNLDPKIDVFHTPIEMIPTQRVYVNVLQGTLPGGDSHFPVWLNFGEHRIAITRVGEGGSGTYIDILQWPKGYDGFALVTSTAADKWRQISGRPASGTIPVGTILSGLTVAEVPEGVPLLTYAAQLERELTDPYASWRKDAVGAWVANKLLPRRNQVDQDAYAQYLRAFTSPEISSVAGIRLSGTASWALAEAGAPVGTVWAALSSHAAMVAAGGHATHDSVASQFLPAFFAKNVHPRFPDGQVARAKAQGWFQPQSRKGKITSGAYYPLVYPCSQIVIDGARAAGVISGTDSELGTLADGRYGLYAESAAAVLAWVLTDPVGNTDPAGHTPEVLDLLRELDAGTYAVEIHGPTKVPTAKELKAGVLPYLTMRDYTDPTNARFGSVAHTNAAHEFNGISAAEKHARALSLIPTDYPEIEGAPLYWDDIGCDFLVVDEAHNFRSLFIPQSRGSIGGGDVEFLSLQSSSKAAWQLEFRSASVRANGGRIVLLTATPATTSPIEFYNVLHYLGEPGKPDETIFDPAGIRDPEEFISRYVEIEDGIVAKPGRDPEERKVAKRFQNLDEFRKIFDRYANRKTVEDAPRLRGVEVAGGRKALWTNVEDAHNEGQQWGYFSPGELYLGSLSAVAAGQRLRIMDGNASGDYGVHSVIIQDGICVIRTEQVFVEEVITAEDAKNYGSAEWAIYRDGVVPLAPPTQQVLIGMDEHQHMRYAAYQKLMGTAAALGMGSLLGSMSRTSAHLGLELYGTGTEGVSLELPSVVTDVVEDEDDADEGDTEEKAAKVSRKKENTRESSRFVSFFRRSLPYGPVKGWPFPLEEITPIDRSLAVYSVTHDPKTNEVPHEDSLKLRFLEGTDAAGEEVERFLLTASVPTDGDPEVYPPGRGSPIRFSNPHLAGKGQDTQIEVVIPFRPCAITKKGFPVKGTSPEWVVTWRGAVPAKWLAEFYNAAIAKYKEGLERGTDPVLPYYTIMSGIAQVVFPEPIWANIYAPPEHAKNRDAALRTVTVEAVARILLRKDTNPGNVKTQLKLPIEILDEAIALESQVQAQISAGAPVIFRTPGT